MVSASELDANPHEERRSAYRVKIPELDFVSLSVDTGLGYPVDYTVTDLSEFGANLQVTQLLAEFHPLLPDATYHHAQLYWRADRQLELDFRVVVRRDTGYHVHYGVAFVNQDPLLQRRLATLARQFQQRDREMRALFGAVVPFTASQATMPA